MAKQAVISESILMDGAPNRVSNTVTQPFDNVASFGPDIAPAKIGALTTRTDNTTGTLTMNASHGFTTAAIIDVYWFNTDGTLAGARHGVVIGTVSVNSVPISGGAGDNLPLVTTAITAMLRDTELTSIVGNNVKAILVSSDFPCFVIFADGSDAILLAVEVIAVNGVYRWFSVNGVTNPLASVTVAKVVISHGDSANTRSPVVCVGYN